MKNANSNHTDDYVLKVIGKTRKELISTGGIDENADKAATLVNLAEEADRLSMIAAEQSSCVSLTDNCTKLIAESRKIIADSKFNPDDVLEKLDAVKRQLIRAHESRKLWPTMFLRIFFSNLFGLAVFIGIIVWKTLVPGSSSASGGMAAGILACAIWGGVGGVVDALVALNYHFVNQDFDKQYEPWYYLHPLIGMSLGAIIYLVLQAGLATISNSNTTAASDTGAVQVGITAFSIAVAFLAGFKQTAAIEFLSRIVKSVFQKEDSNSTKPS
jgi:hypothetical protein